jgi:GT2 family glycosyltransferase
VSVRYGVVVLTEGRRPTELALALASLAEQTDVELDVVVVGNGWTPTGLPDGVRGCPLPENLGIPAGRNAGVPMVRGPLLFFLDDDARLRDPDALCEVARRFEAEPDLGAVQLRAVDPVGRPAPRRWTPRLRVGDPARGSDVVAMWEGAIAIRRELFDRIGGWAAPFFYAHEGIDLAWAVWDAGYRVHYAGDIIALHPAVAPTRHANYYRLSVRNRVFLARRRLPLPIAAVYLTVWTALTVLRVHKLPALRECVRGAVDGFRLDPGPRRPISWRAVWRMSRAGRPPLI